MNNELTDIDAKTFYAAYAARDARFDGIFFVGVSSTGIYCRPVCTARTARADRCRIYRSAAAAEEEGYRPCLRCRPELAPGLAPVDGARRTAERIAYRIAEGALDGLGLDRVAAEFHLSPRQLRRVVRQELGVSPMGLFLTRRLLLAKQLLTETTMPIIDVAFASGFSSLRRFNDAFSRRYGMPPSGLRRTERADGGAPGAKGSFTLRLAYRPPYDWGGILDFLRGRAMPGVEVVDDESYARTVRIGGHTGWVRVRQASARPELMVEVATSLSPVLPALLARLRDLLDLGARPDIISARLREDPRLMEAVDRNPGLRVPGAFDGFELAIRAVLGQQVTVRAATTTAARLIAEFGEPFETGEPGLHRLAPDAARLASAGEGELGSLGIIASRARTVIDLAVEMSAGRLVLDPGVDPHEAMTQLTAFRGIGPWTAHYIAMRALRWPDAFPKEDIAVRNRLGNASPAEAERLSQPWRPWRSYALLHLWRMPPRP